MDDIANAHARLLRDGSVQFAFTRHAPPPDPVRPWSLPEMGDGLFWLIVAAVVAVLVAVGLQAVFPRLRPKRLDDRPPASPNEAQSAAAILPASILHDADALAGAGQYGAAVHALLLRGVTAIQERFPRAVAPAHTSRDIAGLPALPQPLRAAFAGIATRAERAVFAQQPLGQEDWDACRALYAGLVAPQGKAAP